MGLRKPVDGRPGKHVTFEGIHTDVVESFRYLLDEICPGGGCELATIAQTRAAWGECPELLPVLTSTTVFLVTCGKLYDSCARVTSFHASEFWSLQREEVQHLLRNERCESVNKLWAIESCTFEIKAEVKLSKIVWTCGKK